MVRAVIPWVLFLIVLAAALVFAVHQMSKGFDYQCANCGAIFSLPASAAVFSFHARGKRLVRCPCCGATTWANHIPRSD